MLVSDEGVNPSFKIMLVENLYFVVKVSSKFSETYCYMQKPRHVIYSFLMDLVRIT
jgi:hypothetical protein